MIASNQENSEPENLKVIDEFPRLNPDAAYLSRLLCEKDHDFGFILNEIEYYISLFPVSYISKEIIAVIEFQLNHQQGKILIDQSLFGILLTDMVLTHHWQELPISFQVSILQVAFDKLLKAVNQLGKIQFSIKSIRFCKPSIDDSDINIGFSLQSNQTSSRGYIAFCKESGETLLQYFLASEPNLTFYLNRRIPINIRFVYGKVLLTCLELQALEVSDIILLDQGDLEFLTVNIGEHQIFMAQVAPDSCQENIKNDLQIKVVSILEKQNIEGRSVIENDINQYEEEQNIADSESSSEFDHGIEEDTISDEVGNISIAKIPIEVVFELGRKQLSIAQLGQVDPGYVFDLAVNKNEPVSMYANGIKVGVGEIVDVAGRLGVRVLHIIKESGVAAE